MKEGQKKKVRLFEHRQVQYMIIAALPQGDMQVSKAHACSVFG